MSSLVSRLLAALFAAALCLSLPARASAPAGEDGRPVVRIGWIESSFMPSERPDVLDTFGWIRKILPQYRFEIEEYSVPNLEAAIKSGEIDFFLGASGFYRRVFFRGLRDIATMTTSRAPNPAEGSGTLFLVRKDSPVRNFSDLEGKRAATSWKEGFTGVFIPEGEVASRSFDPDRFFTYVIAGSPMTNLLEALDAGRADVALARACSFEELEETDPAYAARFRPVAERSGASGFRCRSSTALYPNWTFVSTRRATPEEARDLTVALLTMPKTRRGAAWGVVSDFASVDGLYRTLKAGPYSYLRVQSVGDFVRRYRTPIAFFLLFVLGLGVHSWRSEWLVRKRTGELRRAVAKEREAEKRQEEAEKKFAAFEKVSVVGAMSSLITHELNGPLSTIANCCAALDRHFEREPASPAVARMTGLIEKQCGKMAGIIERVRGYAKSRGRNLEVISLGDAASRAISVRRAVAPKVDFRLSLPEVPVLVLWDSLELELVLGNLLKNAVAAGAKTVRVVVEGEGETAAVAVCDDAPAGTSDLERASDPFYTTKKEGLGLGLFIVKTLTEKVSGHFSIRREGDWTAARVRLPRSRMTTEKEQ